MNEYARNLQKGDTVVGKSGSEATVYSVTRMASGVSVILDTEYGSVERVYAYDEDVTLKDYSLSDCVNYESNVMGDCGGRVENVNGTILCETCRNRP